MENLNHLILLKFGTLLLGLILLYLVRLIIQSLRSANNHLSGWRQLLILRTINYLFFFGLIKALLTWSLFPELSLKLNYLHALLWDDLLNLLIVLIYLIFFLYEEYRVQTVYSIGRREFGTYLLQYGYYWLLVVNIITFIRIDYFYLALLPDDWSWWSRFWFETLVILFFIGIQFLWLALRNLRMSEVDPELRQLVNETAAEFGISINKVRIWHLKGIINAFATGIFLKSIFLTESLVAVATPEELRMIIGHECAHFKQKHLEIRTLVLLVFVGMGFWLTEKYPSYEELILILLGLLGFLIFQGLARSQEYAADELAGQQLGDRSQMADALQGLFGLTRLPSKFDRMIGLFLAHPDLEARLRRLRR